MLEQPTLLTTRTGSGGSWMPTAEHSSRGGAKHEDREPGECAGGGSGAGDRAQAVPAAGREEPARDGRQDDAAARAVGQLLPAGLAARPVGAGRARGGLAL